MDLQKLAKEMASCPCGREHKIGIDAVGCAPGLVSDAGSILSSLDFPRRVLLVADENTLAAARGVRESLTDAGFILTEKIYPDLRHADIERVNEIRGLCGDVWGVISVGTGSLNDICRYASALENKDFAIFATAPSMDGFASDTAPITEGGFKTSRVAKQPRILLADSNVLADAPAILKGAGFGDMMAKYIGLADWRVSALYSGEYYCEKVAAVTRGAADACLRDAALVQKRSPEAAGRIFESLIMTGLAMGFTRNSRPASGAEHMFSHFWEMKKSLRGEQSDFHGRQVAVATVMCAKIYNELAGLPAVSFKKDVFDAAGVRAAYGDELYADVLAMNEPDMITDALDTEAMGRGWDEVRGIIKEEIPATDVLVNAMKTAGAPVGPSEIGVSDGEAELALRYSPYMRRRLTLLRLMPMMNGVK